MCTNYCPNSVLINKVFVRMFGSEWPGNERAVSVYILGIWLILCIKPTSPQLQNCRSLILQWKYNSTFNKAIYHILIFEFLCSKFILKYNPQCDRFKRRNLWNWLVSERLVSFQEKLQIHLFSFLYHLPFLPLSTLPNPFRKQ